MSCLVMSLHTCRECRLVAVAFLNQLSTAVQPYPCVLPQPFIPLCQLCQCVSSRNSLKFNLISSVSLPIQAQIEHGKTLPTPHSSITATNLFGWPHRPSHFAKAELQPHRTVFFFSVWAPAWALVSQLNQVHTQVRLVAHANPPLQVLTPAAAAAVAYGEVQQSWQDKEHTHSHWSHTSTQGGQGQARLHTHIHVTPPPPPHHHHHHHHYAGSSLRTETELGGAVNHWQWKREVLAGAEERVGRD